MEGNCCTRFGGDLREPLIRGEGCAATGVSGEVNELSGDEPGEVLNCD